MNRNSDLSQFEMRDSHIESVPQKKRHLSLPVFRPPHLVPTQLG